MTDGATEATTQHDWTFIGQRLDRMGAAEELRRRARALHEEMRAEEEGR